MREVQLQVNSPEDVVATINGTNFNSFLNINPFRLKADNLYGHMVTSNGLNHCSGRVMLEFFQQRKGENMTWEFLLAYFVGSPIEEELWPQFCGGQ